MHHSLIARTLLGSAITTAVSTGVLALLSWKDTKHPAAALNATSHIAWGDEAIAQDELDFRHTAVGALLNAGAMAAWSGVHAALPRARSPITALGSGALVSLLAYVTDYYLVPKRLTPGFERRLSKQSLFGAYATLAAALAVSSLLSAPRN